MTIEKRVRIAAKLPISVLTEIDQVVTAQRTTKIAWLEDAAREKLDRHHRGAGTQDGVFSGLDAADVKLVRQLADCLRHRPTSRGFRRAVKANFSWLMESTSPKPGR